MVMTTASASTAPTPVMMMIQVLLLIDEAVILLLLVPPAGHPAAVADAPVQSCIAAAPTKDLPLAVATFATGGAMALLAAAVISIQR
jgi:hypothetical protein